MEKKTINVKTTEQKKTQAGKFFWLIEDSSGVKYSTWDKQMFDDLTEAIGYDVCIEYAVKDGFNNLKNAWVSNKKSETTQKMSSFSQDKNNSIIAQCLTKCAVEMASSLIDAKAEDIPNCMSVIQDVVFNAYKTFLSKLNNGEAEEENEGKEACSK